MEDGEEVHSDIVEGLDEEEDAAEVRQLYEVADSNVGSGSDAEVVQGLHEDEEEEEMHQLYEEDDLDEVSGSDAEGQLFCLEGMYDSSSDSESTSGYRCFVQALFAFNFQRALAAFKPEFAGVRMVWPKPRNKNLPHKKLPLHWLLTCDQYAEEQRAVWLKLVDAVSNTCN